MNFQINQTISGAQLSKFELIKNYLGYRIYALEEDYSYIIAIDNNNLICGCFEFHDNDDGLQLAHMYVVKSLKRKGVGSAIMQEAVNMWGDFKLPSPDRNRTYHYIENGLSFIHHCFDNKILTEPPFLRPEEYVVS